MNGRNTIDSILSINVWKRSLNFSQPSVECMSISFYTCLNFFANMTKMCSEVKNKQFSTHDFRLLNMEQIANLDDFFSTNIRMGIMLWNIITNMKRLTNATVMETLAEAELKNLLSNRKQHPNVLIQHFEIDDKTGLELSRLDQKNVIDLSNIDTIYTLGIDQKETYLTIDEITKNFPGLFSMEQSEIVNTSQLVVLNNKYDQTKKQLCKEIERVKSISYTTNVRDKFIRYLIDIDESLKPNSDESALLDANVAIYAGSIMFISKEKDIFTSTSSFDPTYRYNLREFIRILMEKRMISKHENKDTIISIIDIDDITPRHFRCLILTAHGKSYSILCNTENEQCIIFDSHPDKNGKSTVYLTKNKPELFLIITSLFTRGLGDHPGSYIEIVELCLDEKKLTKINEICPSFI